MFNVLWKFFHTHIGKSTMDDNYLSVDGRETRLDDNPSQELRRQFGELQKRVRALNNYTRFAINNINAMQKSDPKLNFEIQWDPEKVGQGSETWNSDTRSAEHDQVLKTFFI